jgi:hypothetical protein
LIVEVAWLDHAAIADRASAYPPPVMRFAVEERIHETPAPFAQRYRVVAPQSAHIGRAPGTAESVSGDNVPFGRAGAAESASARGETSMRRKES